MPRITWTNVLHNISEAREELQRIEARIQSDKKPLEGELQIMLEHAYHHLNFAWNIRHVSAKRYANLTDDDFNLWAKIPQEIEEWKIKTR